MFFYNFYLSIYSKKSILFQANNKLHFILGCFILCFSAYSQKLPEFVGKATSILPLNSSHDELCFIKLPDGTVYMSRSENGKSSSSSQVYQFDSFTLSRDNRFDKPTIFYHPLGIDAKMGLVWAELIERQGIYMIEVKSESGLEPIVFRNKSNHISGSISLNGKHILLSLESNVSYGVEDIYVMHRGKDGTWGDLRNIGYAINTPFQEVTPFLAGDDSTLYFASNGYTDSFGSFDIYTARRLDDSWQHWSSPVNLGGVVNTNGAETGFSIFPDDSLAYFISTTNSEGYGDIKSVRLSRPIFDQIGKKEDQILNFLVKDQKTQTELIADLEIIRPGQLLSDKLKSNEPYSQIAPSDVSISIKHPGYLPLDTIVFSDKGVYEFSLKLAEKGSLVELRNVLFFQGTSKMIPGSEVELNRVLNFLEENLSVKIELRGHTDNQGDPVLNLELSRQRVAAIQQFLVQKGIDPYRITTRGYGGNMPIAPNDTEVNRAKNRRVEFAIVEN